MISIFPTLYEDELIFSWMSRYSAISAKNQFSTKNSNMFGESAVNHNAYYPVKLSKFVSRIPKVLSITEEYIIDKHTIVPLSKPFLYKEKYNDLLDTIFRSNNKTRPTGMLSLNTPIFNNQTIRFCPVCIAEDKMNNRAPYIRRNHQSHNYSICTKHEEILVEHSIPKTHPRNMFYNLEDVFNTNQKAVEYSEAFFARNLRLCKDIDKIYDGILNGFDLRILKERYRTKLKERGYMKGRRVNREDLLRDFMEYHSKEWLQSVDLLPDIDVRDTWIFRIYSEQDNPYNYHPVKHILFIQFLFSTIGDLPTHNKEYKPFGDGPWPCLNKGSNHYKENTISEFSLFDSGGKVKGRFKCSCAFIYSMHPDDYLQDKEVRDFRVVRYGPTWEQALKREVLSGDINIKQISDRLGCSPNVVFYNIEKMGLRDVLNTKAKPLYTRKENSVNVELLSHRKDILQEYISANPGINRTKLHEVFPTEYRYVFKKDKEWLLQRTKIKRPKEDMSEFWEEKDDGICKKIKPTVDELLKLEKPVRITKTKIIRYIGENSLITPKTFKKVPKTKTEILKYVESKEEFYERLRIYKLDTEREL